MTSSMNVKAATYAISCWRLESFSNSASWEKSEGSFEFVIARKLLSSIGKSKLKLFPVSRQSVLKSQPLTQNSAESAQYIESTTIHYTNRLKIHTHTWAESYALELPRRNGRLHVMQTQLDTHKRTTEDFRSGQSTLREAVQSRVPLNGLNTTQLSWPNQLDTSGTNKSLPASTATNTYHTAKPASQPTGQLLDIWRGDREASKTSS